LQDGTEVELKPLNIGRLKRFMKAWAEFRDIDMTEDETGAFDIYINCAGIALEPNLAHKFETKGEGDEYLNAKYKEYLEDTLDMDSIFTIIEICGGIKLNDPNLIAAATAAAEEVGKN
jgi:hypothetical protein